jgi:asparagine synthase (glutamine-hydrolysing)
MGGFAVIYNLDGRPADHEIFARMLAAIAHRGPDGCGRWIEGPVAMGYQMFHTTPEAVHETQPLSDPGGRYRMVFDGRVDNRQELTRTLRIAGVDLRDDTDAELVLHAYVCFGQDMPRRIIGDFSLMIWDASKRELFCARDPMGIRTFNYYFDGRSFIAASELQQIFADPSVPSTPNEGLVGEYLTGTMQGRDETIFRHLKRLPAAHQMTVSTGGIVKRVSFDLDPRRQIRYRNDEEYADHFREIFAEAVRCRMRAIGGAAAHLSGGVDSTSVVGMIGLLRREGKLADAPFETFSLLFDQPEADERAYIFEAVKQLELTANYPAPVAVDLPMCAEAVLRYRDFTEYPNGGMWNHAWPAAREKGFRVLLSGAGADEWMSGSAHEYADLLSGGQWARLWRRMRDDSRLMSKTDDHGIPDFFLRYAVWPLLPTSLHKLGRQLRNHRVVADFINPDFAQRIGLSDRLQWELPRPAGMTFAQYALYENFNSGWLAHGLDIFDRSHARFGIEERHPFLDRRLYEFLMALPADQLARDHRRKYILRNAMRGLVPDSVLARRDKADFSPLFIEALERMGGERFFDTMTLEAAGWVDRDKFLAAYRNLTRNYKNSNMWPLWSVFAMELWYRTVILKWECPTAPSAQFAPTAAVTAA